MAKHQEKETRSIFLTVAVVIGSIGLLFAIIGLSSNHWFDTNYMSSGLFDCHYFKLHLECADWEQATQAMVVMGTMVTGVGVILLIVNCMPTVAGAACLVGGIFLLLGIIVFGAKTEAVREINIAEGPIQESLEVGWSFALVTIAAILELIAGGLVLAKGKSNN